MDLIKQIQTLKIKYQQWIFNNRYKSGSKIDLEKQLQAIEKANKLTLKKKCQLWVLRVRPGRYKICTKADAKAILRTYGLEAKVDLFQLGGIVVHRTKNPREIR